MRGAFVVVLGSILATFWSLLRATEAPEALQGDKSGPRRALEDPRGQKVDLDTVLGTLLGSQRSPKSLKRRKSQFLKSLK